MAHFAKLGANGKVIQVLTLNNSDMHNADGVEDESVGQQYLETHNNWPAQMWIQTSYNTKSNTHSSGDNSKALRGNYAGIGYTWDEDRIDILKAFNEPIENNFCYETCEGSYNHYILGKKEDKKLKQHKEVSNERKSNDL